MMADPQSKISFSNLVLRKTLRVVVSLCRSPVLYLLFLKETPLCHSAGPVDAKESPGRKREREAREQPAVILFWHTRSRSRLPQWCFECNPLVDHRFYLERADERDFWCGVLLLLRENPAKNDQKRATTPLRPFQPEENYETRYTAHQSIDITTPSAYSIFLLSLLSPNTVLIMLPWSPCVAASAWGSCDGFDSDPF